MKRKAKQFFYDLDTGAVVSIVSHGSGNTSHVVSLCFLHLTRGTFVLNNNNNNMMMMMMMTILVNWCF